jgi:hypothetical protein
MGKFDCLLTFLGILVNEAECMALRAKFANLPKEWFCKLSDPLPSSLGYMVWISDLAASVGGLSGSFEAKEYQQGYVSSTEVDRLRVKNSNKTPYVLNETCANHFDNFSQFLATMSASSEGGSATAAAASSTPKPLRLPIKYVASAVCNSYGYPPCLLCALPIRDEVEEKEKENAAAATVAATLA